MPGAFAASEAFAVPEASVELVAFVEPVTSADPALLGAKAFLLVPSEAMEAFEVLEASVALEAPVLALRELPGALESPELPHLSEMVGLWHQLLPVLLLHLQTFRILCRSDPYRIVCHNVGKLAEW